MSTQTTAQGNNILVAMPLPALLPVVQEESILPPPPAEQFSNQLASAVRSIGWSYAIYWSIPINCPGVLKWKDGFYNGDIKTRKMTSSADGEQPVLQRSEQLRELYLSLLSGDCDHRARRPVGSLSPEDLGEAEWYYTVSMTYAFRPGQDLPGKCLASKEHVWLCHAQSADTKTFSRVLLAKTASIQTVVCVPLMDGVLELGTTDPVLEDPELVSWIVTTFLELQFPTRSTIRYIPDPANESGLKNTDNIVFDHRTMELGEIEDQCLSDANLERITREINVFYSLSDDLEEDDWITDDGNDIVDVVAMGRFTLEGSHSSCFTPWKRSWYSDDMDAASIVAGDESQKLLKKLVAGGASWGNNGVGGAHGEAVSSTRNHVMSERRRREKLNEMFTILKSLVPSITGKVDKASILVQTIAYLKDLEKKLVELKASNEQSSQHPTAAKTTSRQNHREVARTTKVINSVENEKKLASDHPDMGKKRPWESNEQSSQHPAAAKTTSRQNRREVARTTNVINSVENEKKLASDHPGMGKKRPWEANLAINDGPRNVSVTIVDKEVLLEVQCRWKELLMTLVFDAVKRLHLDVVSVQTSTQDGLLVLKIRAQFASSVIVTPGTISEALQKAVGGMH